MKLKKNPNPGPTPHKQYSPQFKEQAIERAEKHGVPKAAQDLGLEEGLVYSWRAKRGSVQNSVSFL